jgi:predicted nucleic acid-binding Zn ribbon protein
VTKTKNPTQVSHLLAEGPGLLRRLREGTAEAVRTLAVLKQHLPPEIAAQVFGAALKDGTLTVLVRSAAWGTRLRYLAPEFTDKVAAALDAAVLRVKVKVRAGRA